MFPRGCPMTYTVHSDNTTKDACHSRNPGSERRSGQPQRASHSAYITASLRSVAATHIIGGATTRRKRWIRSPPTRQTSRLVRRRRQECCKAWDPGQASKCDSFAKSVARAGDDCEQPPDGALTVGHRRRRRFGGTEPTTMQLDVGAVRPGKRQPHALARRQGGRSAWWCRARNARAHRRPPRFRRRGESGPWPCCASTRAA